MLEPSEAATVIGSEQAEEVFSIMDFYSFDEDYLRRLGAHDPETEAHFVAYFSERLRIALRARGIDTQTIEDVRQETFCRVWLAVQEGSINNPTGFGSYVHSVCKNVLSESRRMDFRNEHHPLHQTDIADERLGVEEIIELKENDTLVREGLHRLLPKERDLLLRYYSNEWFALQEREQLAKQMNIPLAHLRVQVQRTREKLAKHVKGRLKSGSDKR